MEGIGIALIIPVLNYNEILKPEGILSTLIYNFIDVLGLEHSLIGILYLIVFMFIFKAIIIIAQGAFLSKIQVNLKSEIRLDIIQKYSKMDYFFYVNSNIGYLNNLVTLETERVVKAFLAFSGVIAGIFYIGIYVLGGLLINYTITCIILLLSGILFYSMKIVHKLSKSYSIAVSNNNSNIQSTLIQYIYNFKYIKATASFDKLIKRLKKDILNLAKLEYRISLLSVLTVSVGEPFAIVIICGLIFYHVTVVGGNITEIGVLIIFLYRGFLKTLTLQSMWQRFYGLVGGVEILEKAKANLDANVEKNGKLSVKDVEKTIIMKNVNFAYDAKKPVLNNININIEKNKTIGIVGESGTGKTTLFDLITGLLSPQSGEIEIGGVNHQDLDKILLRSNIGYVTQEPVLFNDTISNNISLWQHGTNKKKYKEKITKAAKMAFCEKFIRNTTNGYNTIIGDKGIKLSGGQKQRIAIARELFRDPEIMIFDEATSSLDTKSENYIHQSISKLKGSRIIIIISHRLSTIKDCDYIYVLSEGNIVEKGTFNQLYTGNSGVFRNMCESQQL